MAGFFSVAVEKVYRKHGGIYAYGLLNCLIKLLANKKYIYAFVALLSKSRSRVNLCVAESAK